MATWEPSATETQLALLALADYVGRPLLPLTNSRTVIEEDLQKRFNTETDPGGTAWEPLDPDYAAYKSTQSVATLGDSPSDDYILRLKGDMYEDLFNEGSWYIDEDQLIFDASTLPEYAEYHQTGRGDPGNVKAAHKARMTVRAERFAAGGRAGPGEFGAPIGAVRGAHIERSLLNPGGGRGHALPARPFIGISEEAIDKIVLIFSRWLNRGTGGIVREQPRVSAVSVFTHTRGPHAGREQFRIGGRFGPFVE
jgi:phage gpG-like protein